ncbi:hypothetical protein AMTR_s00948p00010970, partial [Amborella trichopoda]
EWLCPLKTLSPQQDHKLMFGLVFSFKSFTTKMDPSRKPENLTSLHQQSVYAGRWPYI